MHENEISYQIIGALIDVHKELGPGLVDDIYKQPFCHEMKLRNIPFQCEVPAPIHYKGVRMESDLWLQFLVAEKVVVRS